MKNLSDVNITITRETAALTQAGFGLALIVGTTGVQSYATCKTLAEVQAAGFADTTDVYKMAAAIFSQNPSPGQVAVVGFADATALNTDLNTLIETRNDWYFLLCESKSAASIAILAAWADANKKLYFAQPDATVAATITLAEAEPRDRLVLIYHDDQTKHADAAWVGRCAPTQPGSITWKFKTLSGVTPAEVTTTEAGDLQDANVNTYVQKYGVNQTSEGKVTSGEFIDVMRGVDFIDARLGEFISRLLFVSPKVPYDVRGIALVLSEVESVMQLGVTNGIIAVDADGNGIFEVSAPDINDIPANEKANRNLPDVRFEFTLAGAIHTLEVFGTVKV